MSRFSLIIPVFQTKYILNIFLNSLKNTLTQESEIIFINDGSSNEIQEMLVQFYNNMLDPKIDIKIITHSKSIGCAISINQALEHVSNKTEYIVILDSDLILLGEWQDEIIRSFIFPEIGIMGGILIYPQTGGIQCCGVTYTNSLCKHLFLNSKVNVLPAQTLFEVQSTIFAFCVIHNNVYKKVGKLDENFFNGYEDLDYQLRTRKLGYKIVTNTNIKHYHWEQSNGIHRGFNRKGNLGLFWAKHGTNIYVDLWNYLFNNLERLQIHNVKENYAAIDLCEARVEASIFWQELSKRKCIKIDSKLDLSPLCGMRQTIWLPEVLDSGAQEELRPYLFLCDHFLRLMDNQYWYKIRSIVRSDDIIIDLYGNILLFNQIWENFWPGTKIR